MGYTDISGHWGLPEQREIGYGTGGTLNIPTQYQKQIGYGTGGELNIPIFGNGGIVRKPTIALIGESGAEAVVPLERDSAIGRSFGGETVNNIEIRVDSVTMNGIDDAASVTDNIIEIIDARLRQYQVRQMRGIGGTAWT
ncbi:MAG: hypothetical protein IJ060_08190 [Oscillospiraceae bacterium]|nr:hypothetical protein [Oscillospiraceae bacterium]